MKRWHWLNLVVLGVLALCADPAHACRYTVREVGFIDVGVEPYWLFVYLPQTTPTEESDGLRDALDAAFADTNIRCEPVPAGVDANHPAARFLSLHTVDSTPAAVLVSPDGPSRRLALPADRPLVEAVSSSLQAVLDSPTRRQILEKSAETYGVVLLIEGPQAERNAAAREAVTTAISYVTDHLEYLPKPIARGPEMVVLDRSSLAREETLLWTLGLKPQDVNEPCAAVFYGRGRWIGPLFKGEMLTDENLMRILPVIGADCECGLDHRWLQGTMLPARWDASLQQKVTASLGFDPESPMIKMEMVSIIRRGMGGFDYPGALLGYQEMEVGGESAEDLSEPSVEEPNEPPAEAETSPVAALSASADPPEVSMRMSGVALVVSLGGMVLAAGVVSVVVLSRARKD